ncbi:MAG: Gfo/Idh/MocA family oxidoreductase [Chitinophagaceae bacterium]|nr:Gfo/Idh/MocA family oxidoreductase [Chitinophagaceae bacterium]
MLNALIRRYNKYRRGKLLEVFSPGFNKPYAFIGAGIHSLSVLYPVLKHLNVSLKYIMTRSSEPDEAIRNFYPGAQFVHSIDHIINDPEIAGVFVCTNGGEHFQLLNSLIKARKPVFVEKPPCHFLSQLQELQAASNDLTICKVGLQRRAWPANPILKKHLRQATSYTYRFNMGSYPQGDVFSELFIHALDFCNFHFGSFKILSATKHPDDQGVTYQLHVQHNNNLSGLLDLSTKGSWNDPIEEMIVDCTNEQLELRYPLSVTGTRKPTRILNMPTERVLQKPVVLNKYFTVSNLIVPAADQNSFFVQGFYGELLHFLQLTSGTNSGEHLRNDLPGLSNIYGIMEEMRKL